MSTERKKATEWPTLAVAAIIYIGWLSLTMFHASIPLWLLAILGALVIAWHSSLQHEILHGHPTASRNLNYAIAFPPLSLWLPFDVYRDSHLKHHEDENLTDPFDDPESKYLTLSQWCNASPLVRSIEGFNATLLGRLIIGPMLCVTKFFLNEIDAQNDSFNVRSWCLHLIAVSIVLFWLVAICHMSLTEYVLLFVYPGTSLLLLRSFAEHRAAIEVEKRTAIIESTSLLSLLFLNNNLHAVHHRYPGAAWYRLPGLYARMCKHFIERNGSLVYRGYREVFNRYLLSPQDQIVHPYVDGSRLKQLANYARAK